MSDASGTDRCCARCENGGWCLLADGHIGPHEGAPTREGPEQLVQVHVLVPDVPRTARMAGHEIERKRK